MADREIAETESLREGRQVAVPPAPPRPDVPDSAGRDGDPGAGERHEAGYSADPGPDRGQTGAEGKETGFGPSAQSLAVEGSEITDGAPNVSGSGLRSGTGRLGDRIFFGLTAGAAGFVTLIVVLIAIFLILKSVPSIANDKVNFLTSFNWSTRTHDLRFGIPTLLWVTVIISALALLIAVPLAIGIALFTTQYVPRRIAAPIAYTIDLLAAIPSVIYGIWGARVLSPELTPVQNGLSHLHFIPLFTAGFPTGTIFDGSIVLAIMVLPIITAISRDVFERTPSANIEAALALGATRWETIRMSVLPYGRPGVISGAMLGLGRALGETMAVYFIVSSTSSFNFSLFNGGETFASKIALSSAEFGANPGPYLAAGLVLFVLTFIVNALARYIVNRRRDFV